MLVYKKKAVFFDLDHTLWDFNRNASETLEELYQQYRFEQIFGQVEADRFIHTFLSINEQLWDQYNAGAIGKSALRERRFRDTFVSMGADPRLLPSGFENDYLTNCPRKAHLFPHAFEILDYLKTRYTLHVISNGFRETSHQKINFSGLHPYFNTVVVSDLAGVLKPDRKIFEYTLTAAGVHATEAVMIGDNLEADVRGALGAGIEAIHFNPYRTVPAGYHVSIESLSQLRGIL